MSSNSLNNKTVRPGSFKGYSYYHSDRHNLKKVTKKPAKHRFRKLSYLIILVTLTGIAVYYSSHLQTTSAKTASIASTTPTLLPTKAAAKKSVAIAAIPVNQCAGNILDKIVVVSISKRQLWACQLSTPVFNSEVITGMSMYPDTITPTGTYHVYEKETDVTLTGTSSAGSWSDPVSYWMPFLDNQYGQYGFHDATWRSNSDFGNIDPSSSQASHGCVELPLATAKWLYDWVQVGTTVKINS